MQRAAFVRIWHREDLSEFRVMLIAQDGDVLEQWPLPYSGEFSKQVAQIDAREAAKDMARDHACPVKEIG